MFGGGVLLENGATLQNCLIYGNSAYSYNAGSELHPNWVGGEGGGVYCHDSSIINCTITNNVAIDRDFFPAKGGGVLAAGTSLVVNVIILDNVAQIGSNLHVSGGNTNIQHCAIDPPMGTNPVRGNPQLTSGSHLSRLSPCIDAGTTMHAPALDMEREVRSDSPAHPNAHEGSIIDVGADEYVDQDGDQSADWEESIAGTSATNAQDFLSIDEIVTATNGQQVVIYWDTIPGRVYSVYSCSDLLDAWTNRIHEVFGDGTRKSYAVPLVDEKQYFRIRVELEWLE